MLLFRMFLVVTLIAGSDISMAVDQLGNAIPPHRKVDPEIKAFYVSMASSDLDGVKRGINQFGVNGPDQGFDYPLLYATRVGSHCTVKFLLDKYYSSDSDAHLKNVAYLVSSGVDVEMVSLFLNFGVEKNYSEDEMTALYMSMEKGKIDVAKLLLRKNIDVKTITDTGETLLFAAALSGSDFLIDYLIKMGVDRAHKNNAGNTAKDFAVYRWGKDSKIAELLKY